MNYLSICSGIEAATVGWHPLGWNPVAFSEIESFPRKVLAHHYPDVPNWGDMTKFKEWPNANIDVLVGGTPCQSFSIAGLRKGLNDPRGNLMLTYLGIANRYKPKRIVWENVPGVLSSNGGRDFGTFLQGLAQLGYGFAYRVLDAQFSRTHEHPRAVPQRRRRVFVVGHLGDWRSAAAVLFDSESLRGNPPPSRSKGQEIARSVAHCLKAKSNDSHREDSDNYVAHTLRGEGFDASEDGTGRGTPLVAALAHIHAVAYGIDGASHCLRSGASKADKPCSTTYLEQQMRVRRLTPLECERLQGFPDNYTSVPGASNAARYKALGNSMAVNCMRILGYRIAMAETIDTISCLL